MLRPISITYFLCLFLSFFSPIIIIFVWQSGGGGDSDLPKPNQAAGKEGALICFAAICDDAAVCGFSKFLS